jgi:hypothetical protein
VRCSCVNQPSQCASTVEKHSHCQVNFESTYLVEIHVFIAWCGVEFWETAGFVHTKRQHHFAVMNVLKSPHDTWCDQAKPVLTGRAELSVSFTRRALLSQTRCILPATFDWLVYRLAIGRPILLAFCRERRVQACSKRCTSQDSYVQEARRHLITVRGE